MFPGGWEWLVILAIVLLIFGAGKLPSVMGDVAKGIKKFKSGMAEDPDADKKTEPELTFCQFSMPSPVQAGSISMSRPVKATQQSLKACAPVRRKSPGWVRCRMLRHTSAAVRNCWRLKNATAVRPIWRESSYPEPPV